MYNTEPFLTYVQIGLPIELKALLTDAIESGELGSVVDAETAETSEVTLVELAGGGGRRRRQQHRHQHRKTRGGERPNSDGKAKPYLVNLYLVYINLYLVYI